MPNHPSPTIRWYALALLLLGAAGFTAVWTLLALRLDSQCAWLAPTAAADVALLQWLANWPRGRPRALAAVLTTAAVIALANYMIAAGQIGQGMGMRPAESALRMGAGYAWLLATLANTRADLIWYAAGLLLALWSGLSDRRRPAPSVH